MAKFKPFTKGKFKKKTKGKKGKKGNPFAAMRRGDQAEALKR